MRQSRQLTIDATPVSAARDIRFNGPVSSTGPVSVHAVTGDIIGDSIATTDGAITLLAGGDVEGLAGGRMALSAGGMAGDVAVTATAGRALLGAVTAGRDATITAATIDATPVSAARDILFSASGMIGATGLAAGRDLTVTAGPSISAPPRPRWARSRLRRRRAMRGWVPALRAALVRFRARERWH
jgi:hypothetical protein